MPPPAKFPYDTPADEIFFYGLVLSTFATGAMLLVNAALNIWRLSRPEEALNRPDDNS